MASVLGAAASSGPSSRLLRTASVVAPGRDARYAAAMSEPQEAFPNHTVAGKLVIIATICVAIGLVVATVLWMNDFAPAGSYPLALLFSAIAPVVAAFYAICMLCLRLLGIPVRKPSEQPDRRA